MRYFTALKYDSLKAFSKLKPPSGYNLVVYHIGDTPIVALEDPKAKWVYIVTPEDITPDCQIKASAIRKDRHIATIGLYEAWDISIDLVPLSKVVKSKCRNSYQAILPIDVGLIDTTGFFKKLNQRLQQLYKQPQTKEHTTQKKIHQKQQNNTKTEKGWIINHPPTAMDEWIIASILGLIFLTIFGRKVD